MLQQFKIRDLRKKDQFKIDDKYLNGYAKVCGVYATVVYNSLSRHAEFSSQEAFPSIELIAKQHNISKPTVNKGIKNLEKYGIIKVIKQKGTDGKQKNNLYILIDKSEWRPVRVNDIDSDSRVNIGIKPSKRQSKNRVNDVDCKDNKDIKDNTIKDIATPSVADINPLIEKFKTINPSYEKFFSNKTQRSALERLVKQHDFNKVVAMIDFLPQIQGQRYAPVITTPLQLEDKLAQLINYKLKEDNKKPTFVKVS